MPKPDRKLYTSLHSSKRKERLLAYLKQNPDTTPANLHGTDLFSDLALVYKCRIKDARKDAGIEEDFKRLQEEKRAAKIQRTKEIHREKIRIYLRSHPEATMADICKKRLHHTLYCGYNSIGEARKAVGLLKPENKLKHDLLYDTFGTAFDIAMTPTLEADLAALFDKLLEGGKSNMAKWYYGIGYPKQSLEEISIVCNSSHQNIQLIFYSHILPVLRYLNNQKQIADICLQHTADKAARTYLSSICCYGKDYVPYHLDQLHPKIASERKKLEKLGITTVSQFLDVYRKGKTLPGFGKTSSQKLLGELQQFDIRV